MKWVRALLSPGGMGGNHWPQCGAINGEGHNTYS
jgi:hypothetical protein